MAIETIDTEKLRLAFEVSGPSSGETLILLHGWPDSPRTWDNVLPHLHQKGFRTVAPYVRGYGPSTFRDSQTAKKYPRTGEPVALADDAIRIADHLGLKKFHFIGHDWGARTGYVLAAVLADRLKSLVAMSVPFAPGKAKPPNFPQAHSFWYQWFLCSNPGEEKLREDPIAFGRAQWDVWSPAGWYTEKKFQEAAESWTGEDFADVVLNYYRSRWGHATLDPAYRSLTDASEKAQTLAVPTLLIHGAEDGTVLLKSTDGAERFFTGGYRRAVIKSTGHFPQREAPQDVADLILEQISGGTR
jgi:pimeloyl-ACP methyl ester carboxylesterase